MHTQLINEAKDKIQKALEHLHQEYAQLQAGRAHPSIVENINVDAYSAMQPIKSLANISTPESQQITIEPWDKSLLSNIETAIRKSELGLNPLNDGSGIIRITLPQLTEERRRDLVKVVNEKAENEKVTVRQIRQDAIQKIRNSDLSEDQVKNAEIDIQEIVNDANKDIDNSKKSKEESIMTV